MSHEQRPWYERILPPPLRRAFAAQSECGQTDDPTEYLYDETAFVRFEGADLDEDINPKTRESRAGFTGCAEFRHVQDPATPGVMPLAVDHTGRKLSGAFLIEYDTLPIRAQHLKMNGIRPTETEKAIKDLDAKLGALRRKVGLGGQVIEFAAPSRDC